MLARLRKKRLATILPLVATSLVGLLAILALAIDLGMVMVARNQCQNAADAAALAAARLLNFDPSTNYNSAAATTAAINAAEANQVLSQQIQPSQVNVSLGAYTYNSSQQQFVIQIPASADAGYTLAQVTVSFTGRTAFAGVLGFGNFTASATATAAHHPRDVAIVLDLTGSMKFGSLLGLPHYGDRHGSNNPESVYPTFGPYSNVSLAGLQSTSTTVDGSGNAFPPCNVSDADTYNQFAPPLVQDFYSQTNPSTVQAFTPAPAGYATTPGGDNYPRNNFDASSTWSTNVSDYVGTTNYHNNFESNGYDYAYSKGNRPSAFNGYTQGPSYWGKSFGIWPPDPRPTWDWRQRFFIDAITGNPVTQNARLFDSFGNWQAPSSLTYKINYQAILQWLTQTPNPFPPQVMAGRIHYYDAIPSGTDTTLNNRFWTQWPLTNINERFWKEYIDFVLGVWQTDAYGWTVVTRQTGYGDDFSWGTTKINVSFNPATDPQHRYMDYTDNPERPRLHFWFGPMTFVDFISNYNLNYSGDIDNDSNFFWMAGTAHEVPLYECKIAMQAAFQDIQTNHPNDWVSLIFFSTPKKWPNDTNGRYNAVRTPLGTNYSRMTSALWFPLTVIDNPGTYVNPYDTRNMLDVPHAWGGTCYAMGLMLAFNQLSGNSSLQTFDPAPSPVGNAGGLGRKGAQKMIIFETDGEPNTTASAAFVNGGAYNSYYQVRYNRSNPSASDFPTNVSGYSNNSSTVTTQIYSVVQQFAASDTASSPGYTSANRKALLHCIGFGPVFTSSNPNLGTALTTLQTMQYYGNTQSSPSTPLPSYKIVTGTPAQIQANLRTAIRNIMDTGVTVFLLQ